MFVEAPWEAGESATDDVNPAPPEIIAVDVGEDEEGLCIGPGVTGKPYSKGVPPSLSATLRPE